MRATGHLQQQHQDLGSVEEAGIQLRRIAEHLIDR
jgi:hypothetical protein